MSLDELKTAVASHTTDVLQALKNEGIEPLWVQVGNETNNGMLWPTGKIDWNKSGTERYADYVALNNAGYDAVKRVFPNAKVILHIANAYNAGSWDGWFFKDITAAGAKFDIIGLSHYPDYEQWNSNADDAVSNANAANSVAALGKLYNVPVMICETGYSTYDPERARTVMQDLLKRMEAIPQCAGIFYWEPETDGKWKPAYYSNIGWNAYSMGAFSGDVQLQPSTLSKTATGGRRDCSTRCSIRMVRPARQEGQQPRKRHLHPQARRRHAEGSAPLRASDASSAP